MVAAVAGAPAANNLQNALLSGALALVPVAIGIAVLRYRLYDIDRVISRTVAYAIITGLLVGIYAGLVLLAARCSACTRRWRWPPPRWPRRRCSTRSGGGCRMPWTGGSTAPGTTPEPDRGRVRGPPEKRGRPGLGP